MCPIQPTFYKYILSETTTARQLNCIIKTCWQQCRLSGEAFTITCAGSAHKPVSSALERRYLDNFSYPQCSPTQRRCNMTTQSQQLTRKPRGQEVPVKSVYVPPLFELNLPYKTFLRQLRRCYLQSAEACCF